MDAVAFDDDDDDIDNNCNTFSSLLISVSSFFNLIWLLPLKFKFSFLAAFSSSTGIAPILASSDSSLSASAL